MDLVAASAEPAKPKVEIAMIEMVEITLIFFILLSASPCTGFFSCKGILSPWRVWE
jgi:hypothetical protein